MSQTKQLIREKDNKQSSNNSEENLLVRARETKIELTEQKKIPQEYTDLVEEARSLTRKTAQNYIQQFQEILYKAGIRGEKAKLLIIEDCQRIGWKYNTIRKWIDSSNKKPNMQKGAKAANESKKKNKSKKTQGDGVELETTELESMVFPQEITKLFKYKTLGKHIAEKIQFSLDNGGKGDIMVTTKMIKKEEGLLDYEVINIAAVVPTDRVVEKAKTTMDLKN